MVVKQARLRDGGCGEAGQVRDGGCDEAGQAEGWWLW